MRLLEHQMNEVLFSDIVYTERIIIVDSAHILTDIASGTTIDASVNISHVVDFYR